MLSQLDRVRDESDGEHPVRLVFEPKSSRLNPDEFMTLLLAQTSMEQNVSMNLVMVGMDGRPQQKGLKAILSEWLGFRETTVTRRLAHRLNKVEQRIHILEGRQLVFLSLDAVIRVTRESDEPKPELVPCAVNLFWGFKEVTKELTELTGLPSKAGNDANVAALGEAWKGAAAGAKNVILVTLGTGVGGGIIVDVKIVGGAHGAGGEIGHAAVDHEEKEACNCGNCGCLEQYASATGIVRVAQRTLAATDEQTVLRKFTKLSAKNVLDAFKEGDKVACDVMAQVGEMLGGTLAMFACVTDPEAIVIGGGVSKAGQPLIDCIQKYYEKYAFTACKKTPIILATLGNDAGIYGSARMVIKEV